LIICLGRARAADTRSTATRSVSASPVVHQKWELPVIEPLVFEHRLWRLACPGCGKGQLAGLPDGVTASMLGPRMEAHIAVLAGVYRLSRRQIADVMRDVFGCPISVGAVDAAIMRISRVLTDPWTELRDAVRAADAVYADETSWRLRGTTQWLWVAASALMACYRIDPHRTQQAAKALLGEDFGSFVITDRYAGYHWLDVLQQQLCWAHVIRPADRAVRTGGRTGQARHPAARGGPRRDRPPPRLPQRRPRPALARG
jgi:transposase